MKLISLTCPNCNANLSNIDPNRKECYCQYCGTKIVLDDGAKKHEFRFFNETRARAKELEEQRKSRELEIKREEAKERRAFCKRMLKICCAILVVGLLCKITGLTEDTISYGIMCVGFIGTMYGILGSL